MICDSKRGSINWQRPKKETARKQAKEILQAVGKVVSDAEAKLQQIYQDQPPRGVRIS